MIKVIIVDDELTIREGMKKSINWEAYGMKVGATVGNSFEALERIEQSPPDILILDIMLDGMDGLEILDIVKNKYPNIYVILISGHDEFEYAQRAIELNAFCYLLKPIDEEQLKQKLIQIKTDIDLKLDKLKKDKELNERLKESLPIIREHLFYEIIQSSSVNLEKIFKKADFLGINLKVRQYAVMVLELHTEGNKNEYDRNLMNFAVMDICEAAFLEVYQCYSFNLRENIGILICSDHIVPEYLKEIIKGIIKQINKKLGVSATAGLGNVSHKLTAIVHSCKEAVDALEYKALMGLNRIIDTDIISKSTNKKPQRNPLKGVFDKRHHELKYALKTMNHELIKSILGDVITGLEESLKSDIKNLSRDLLQIANSINTLVISLDINIEHLFDSGNELYGTLKKMETIEEIRKGLELFLQKVLEEIQKQQKDSNSFYVNKARKYIEENLYGELSLSHVADYLYVSSNYLSRIFKQEVGESFIEYVIRKKMLEARKILETSTYKVYEIANELNYRDVNYFTKTFKKIFGVTPSEYRDLL